MYVCMYVCVCKYTTVQYNIIILILCTLKSINLTLCCYVYLSKIMCFKAIFHLMFEECNLTDYKF